MFPHHPWTDVCIQLRAFINGKWEVRNYTPICFHDGICVIFFRVYRAPEGVMSRYMKEMLKEDDWIEMRGPVGLVQHRHHINAQGLAVFGEGLTQVLGGSSIFFADVFLIQFFPGIPAPCAVGCRHWHYANAPNRRVKPAPCFQSVTHNSAIIF